jgi:hypothetical protein
MELVVFQGNRAVLDMESPLTATFQIQTYILPSRSAAASEGSGPGEGGG